MVLLLDFDGTLVRIQRSPEQVMLPPRIRRLLARIAAKDVLVGVVSGRGIDDVRKKVGLKGLWYAGDHGFCLCNPRNRIIKLFTLRESTLARKAESFLARNLRNLPRILLEHKRATVAVHYRTATAPARSKAARMISQLLDEYPGLSLLRGKKVWEILPSARVDKWTAVRHILKGDRRAGKSNSMVFYVGDDKTDERVFQKMNGISVAVGKKRRTAAKFYLRTPTDVWRFLGTIERFVS
jgi:trehalose-phosphatase